MFIKSDILPILSPIPTRKGKPDLHIHNPGLKQIARHLNVKFSQIIIKLVEGYTVLFFEIF